MKTIEGQGRSRSSQHRPPRPLGRVVNLRAPEPITPAKKTRSLQMPKDNHPGLAFHFPESIIRKQSLQENSLQQLQKLRLELLGERKQQQLMANDDNVKQKEQKPTSAGVAVPITSGVTIPARARSDGSIPVQTPYGSGGLLLNASGGLLMNASTLSCISTDHMLGQVNDSLAKNLPKAGSDEKNKELVEAIEITTTSKGPGEMSVAQPKKSSSRRYSSYLPLPLAQSKKSSSSRSNSYLSKVTKAVTGAKQKRDGPSPLTIQPFDMQKSLEKQLAQLPGARLPGTSTQSFDDHSFIVSSGTKSVGSNQQRLKEKVSILPCQSFTPSPKHDTTTSVMERTLKKRNTTKRLPPRGRVDTVKIDKGLSVVDPNNLKPQMQEILQKKNKEQRGPVQQVGKIVEAIDLVDNSKHKGVKMVRLGSKLRDLFPDRLKDPWPRHRESHRGNPSSCDNSKSSSRDSSRISNSDDERLFVKQTIEQENYKITKVLGAGMTKSYPDTGPPMVHTVLSGNVSEVVAADDTSGSSGKAGSSNMEVVRAAEGKNPMYKVPDGQDTTPKELIEENQNKKPNEPTKGLASLARRLKQKELLAKVKERLEKGETKITSSAVNNIVEERKPSGFRLSIDRPESPTYEYPGGSFCPTPTLESSFSLNRHITDVAKKFAQEHNNEGGLKMFSENEQELAKCDDKKSEENSPHTRAEAMRQARHALTVSLKHRIVTELRRQKAKELEAAMRGEIISEEEKAKQLEIVRRLHLRREALQHLSDEDIRKVFNERLQRTKQNAENRAKNENTASDDEDDVIEDPNSGDDRNSGERDEATSNRKHVSFARHTKEKLISPNVTVSGSEDEDGESYYDYDDYSEQMSQYSQGGIMSWAYCGAPAVVNACTPIDKRLQQNSKASSSSKTSSARDSASAASRSSRDLSRKGRTRGKESPAPSLSCALVPEGSNDDDDDDDESQYNSDSSESRTSYSGTSKSTSKRRRNRRKSARSKSREKGSLGKVLSTSESSVSDRSRGSYETRDTRDTRDTRRTEYTEGTRDSCESRDSRATRETRGSYYSYATGDTDGTRSRKGYRKGSRSYVSSVAETEFSDFIDEYDDVIDPWDDRLFQCGD